METTIKATTPTTTAISIRLSTAPKKSFTFKSNPEVVNLLRNNIKKYSSRKEAEKTYTAIERIVPKKAGDEKDMGTYQLVKNKTTGRVSLTGFHKKPGVIMNSTGIEGASPFTRRKNKEQNKDNIQRQNNVERGKNNKH